MRRARTVLAIGLLACAACATARPDPARADGGPAPADLEDATREGTPPAGLRFTTLDGGELDLSLELELGRPVVLVFWQPWCDACRRDLPPLAVAARNLDGRVLFVGVLSGPDAVAEPEEARRLVAELELEIPQVRDPESELLRLFEAPQIPTYVVLTGGDSVAYRGRHPPADWESFVSPR